LIEGDNILLKFETGSPCKHTKELPFCSTSEEYSVQILKQEATNSFYI
jgi:hypothetical protein